MKVALPEVQPFEERLKRGLVRPGTKERRCVHELKARSLERDAAFQGSMGLVSIGPCDRNQQPHDRLRVPALTILNKLKLAERVGFEPDHLL